MTSTTKVSENATYYAQWTVIDYDITYQLNGIGSLPTDVPTKYNIEQEKDIPNAIGDSANTFGGWTGSNGNTP